MSQQTHQTLDTFKQRELEVLRLIAAGLSNEEIAARLFIEVTTVRWHNRQIYSKLGVHSRTLAVALARNLGLLDGEILSAQQSAIAVSRANLPTQTTSFVGREREITKVRQLLAASRLLTLTGAGGTGKTRMALEVAGLVKDDYADGVWFIPLVSVHDPDLVADTIANVLKVTESTAESVDASLVKHLYNKQALLILDNFEHVIEAAQLLSTLLAGAANLKILVTSRQVLHLYGEQECPIRPLAVPDAKRHYPAEDLLQFEAVRLFVERAQASYPAFQATTENVEAVAAVCTRLDGLPLAIELAAARIKLLAPHQLLARLERSFDTLGQGPSDAPTRHRTLRATMDWSYDLLSPDEKALFNRLGIFNGGWSLQTMEAVCAEGIELDILDGVAALIDKSLVRQVTDSEDEPRFTMLETLREYALERLAAAGELEQLRERHARYYIELCRSARIGIAGAVQLKWAQRLHADYDNVRATMEWTEHHDPAAGMDMVETLMPYWMVRGHMLEGAHWIGRLLARDHPVPFSTRLNALLAASRLAYYTGDSERAGGLSREALTLAQRMEEPMLLARAVLRLAGSTMNPVDSPEDRHQTREMLEGALTVFRDENDTAHVAMTLNSLGVLARLSSEYAEARERFAESLKLFRALGDQWGATMVLINLGFVALRDEDFQQANTLLGESFAICQQMDDLWGMAVSADGLAFAMGRAGDASRAARLLGAAEALREQVNATVQPDDQPEYEYNIAAIRARVGDDATFAAARTEGKRMSLEQLIDEVRKV